VEFVERLMEFFEHLAKMPLFWIVAVIVISLTTYGLITSRKRYKPKFRGPSLTGTARVLSVERIARVEGPEHPLRIGLRVEILGRQPYDVAVDRYVDIIHVPRLQPGAIVPVQVDSANPQNVRIDFNQPMTGPPQFSA
jgi:hypothetical protein